MKSTATKSQSSRERILQTAVVLFARQGFDGTGLRELAREAGVNLAMINYFFGSKKRLLTEVLDVFFAGYLEVMTTELSGEDGLPVKFERFIASAIAFFEAKRHFLIVAITDLHHEDPEIIEHKARWGSRMMAVMDKEVCRPLARTTGTQISPTLIAPLLTSMMASRYLFSPVMVQIGKDGPGVPDLQQHTAMITSLFLGGIAGLGVPDGAGAAASESQPGSTEE